MKRSLILRELLNKENIVIAPSAFDALSAKLIEKAGFKAISTTGYGISAVYLGAPDIGLLSFQESLEMHRRIIGAVKIPVIADIDTGYGGPLNVARTVREFERIGAAGVIIEDQVEPKRCGYIPATRRILPIEKMISKIKAAVDAREDENFLIIARTDADDISTEEAIKRMKAYLKAGADMVKSQPKSIEQLKIEIREVNAPMHIGLGIGPLLNVSIDDLREWGLEKGIVSFPLALLFASTRNMLRILDHIKRTGSLRGAEDALVSFNEFIDLLDYQYYKELEQKYTESIEDQ
jgi:methylisocitrate lyase